MQLSHSNKVLIVTTAHYCSYVNTVTSILREVKIEMVSMANPSALHDSQVLAKAISEHRPSLVILAFTEQTFADAESWGPFCPSVTGDIPIIAMVPKLNAKQVRTVLKLGVNDFILPPFVAANVLPRIWRLLRNEVCASDTNEGLQGRLAMHHLGLIGKSPVFVEEIRKLCLVSRCDVTVMISGETGTGKELVARAIHYLSARAGSPFVPIDCGAIPADLTESELFGHERGAFTGAVTKHQGLVAAADGGTLFLDEVDALSLNVQAKLLRFLQQREYRPLGSSHITKADVRVISATNRDLRKQVRTKVFREDLYYRLNVVQLRMPSLRERHEDVSLLAQHFAAKHAARLNQPVREFSRGALQTLAMHHWSGNIRELENVIESAVVLSDGPVLRSSDLPLCSEQPRQATPFREAKARIVTEFEREYVTRLLSVCGGNVSEAARVAGKNRRAFWELIRKHGVDVRELRDLSDMSAGRSVRAASLGAR